MRPHAARIYLARVLNLPLSLPPFLPVKSHEERDRRVQDVHHSQGHDWDVGALPHQGEEQGQEGFRNGGEEGVVLGAETDAGLGEEASIGRKVSMSYTLKRAAVFLKSQTRQ